MSEPVKVEAWLEILPNGSKRFVWRKEWTLRKGALVPLVRIPEGLTQEMVDAVRDALPDVTFDDDGTPHPMPFQQWEDYLTAAADILQALLDAGGDDE